MLISETASKLKASQTLSDETEVVNSPQESSDFDAMLKLFLPTDQAEVNEEELFSAVIYERIAKLKGEDVARKYQEFLGQETQSLTRKDGYVPVEDAANNALSKLVASGDLSAEQASQIKSQAFVAAQLDDNHAALWDGRGGPNDPTIAVAKMEAALTAAKLMLNKIDSNDQEAIEKLDGLNAEESAEIQKPDGQTFDGENGFLFKPISDNQSKLAILMPEFLKDQVLEVILKDEQGREVEQGVSFGYGEPGTREKFSFNKKGEEYPSNLTVQATLIDGTSRQWYIPNPSLRYD